MTTAEHADPVIVNPGFGQLYGCGPQCAYMTTKGVQVWMWRKGQKVRYYDAAGAQVGPEHRNVVPAIVWAAAEGWIDPLTPMLSIAVTAEVRAESRSRATHEPWDESNPDAGAWQPMPSAAGRTDEAGAA